MVPYYQDSAVAIYHGDCREIVPGLGRFDLLLTDPPYPKLKGGTAVTFTSGVGRSRNVKDTVGTPWGEDLSGLTAACRLADLGAFVFCSYHSVATMLEVCGLAPCALVSWYQRNAMPPMFNAPHFQVEYVWALKVASGLEWRKLKTFYDIPRLQSGCMATERICTNGQADHPAQKPIALIKSLLAVGGTTILDCYAGTCTTGRAAKDLGRRCVCIEREERYCEIGARRMAQEVLGL